MSDDNAVPPVQLSTFQRVLGFVRFWLNVRANVTVVLANQAAIAQALNNSVMHLNRLNARVSWYEHRVPLIAKEYAAFRHSEKRAVESAEAEANYVEREARRAAAPQLEVVQR